jgi:hypothetical protein
MCWVPFLSPRMHHWILIMRLCALWYGGWNQACMSTCINTLAVFATCMHVRTRMYVKCVCGQQWTCSVASAFGDARQPQIRWLIRKILNSDRATGEGRITHSYTRGSLVRALVFVYADRDTWVKRRGINHFFPPPRGCHARGAGLYFWSDKFQLSF